MAALQEAARDPGRVVRGPVLWLLLQTAVGIVVGVSLVDVVIGKLDQGTDLRGEAKLLQDDYLSWRNRPGYWDETTTISSLGLRSPEIPADASPTEVRILGVGPSTTFGAGPGHPSMSEVWAPFLEQRLEADGDADWRVLNGGVNGYSTIQACRRGMELIPEVEPDLLLIFIDPSGVSLLDNTAARHARLWHGRAVPPDIVDTWPELLLPVVLAVHERLLEWSNLYVRTRMKANVIPRPVTADHYIHAGQDAGPWAADAYAETLAELVLLRDTCAKAGIELRVVLSLDGVQYSEAWWERYLLANQQRGAPALGTDREEPQRALARDLSARGIASWSLYDLQSGFGDDKKWILSDRSHWSREGHLAVARVLYEDMRDEELPPILVRRRAANPRGRD